MALLKAKQGSIYVNSKDIPVIDISFDTEFDKIERQRLTANIFNNNPNITIGSFGKIKFGVELVASGDSGAPNPAWSDILVVGGLTSDFSIPAQAYQSSGSLSAYVSGYKIDLNNATISNISFSHEAGNIPQCEIEIIGVVAGITTASKEVAQGLQPELCGWSIAGFSDVVSFNVSYDIKVEKVYTVDDCNAKLRCSEATGNVEVVIYGGDLGAFYNYAKENASLSITITNNAPAGKKIDIPADIYVDDVKLGEQNGLTTVSVVGKRQNGNNIITFS